MAAAAETRPLGLYLHVPFCARKCPYCDFNTYAGLEALHGAFVEGLCRELAGVAPLAEGRPLTSIFLGGGTPTLLEGPQLARIFATIREHFALAPGAEISSEANPGTVDLARFEALRAAGVNRLSMGVQSFQPAELDFLGRIHGAEEARNAFAAARAAGFDSINLDLMFGLPGQAPEAWRASLDTALDLGTEHLSLYSLIVEPGTPLARWVAEGSCLAPDDDRAAELYAIARERMAAAGYRHYEVSNWAKDEAVGALPETPSHACRHNLLYWRNGDFLAVGPGAHGCLHRPASAGQPHQARRWWNLRGVEGYLRRLAEGGSAEAGSEVVEGRAAMGESMMLGLRLIEEGLVYARFTDLHGRDPREVFGDTLDELEGWGLLRRDRDAIRLTERGLLVGNRVFERFVEPA